MYHLRKTTILLFICLLSQTVIMASTVDSLRQVIRQSKGQEKSLAYRNLYHELNANGDADAALVLIDEWIGHEKSQSDIENEGKARWSKIVILSNYGLDDNLLKEAPIQMKWFEEHEAWDYYYNTWDCVANVYLYSNHVQKALHEAKQMLADAQLRNQNVGRVISYQLSGIVYESMGQYELAVEALDHAVALQEETDKESTMLTNIYDYLAQTLDEKKDYARELETTDAWLKAIERIRKKYNHEKLAMIGTSVACMVQRTSALTGLGRYDEADKAMAEAEHLLAEMSTPLTQYRVLYTHARLALAKGEGEQALAFTDSLENMGLEVGGDLGSLRANILMAIGRYEEAATLYCDLANEKDSVFNADMRLQLDELTTMFKVDEIEMHRRLERARLIGVIIGLVLITLLLFLYARYRSAKRLAQKNRELERMNEELKLANQKAEDSSKMKSEFIKSISHEIRTPLNILSGFTQILTNPDMELPDDQLANIHNRINESTDRITGLVQKMLDLSETSTHSVIERTDTMTAREFAEKAAHDARISSTNNVSFNIEESPADAGLTSLLTNEHYAVRALSLLLDNARKFTTTGYIKLRIEHKTDTLYFVVEDTGIGIAADMTEMIFEEFVQIDKYTDGTGIGLPIARSIARRLGGDVALDTTYHEGARFTLSLPLAS